MSEPNRARPRAVGRSGVAAAAGVALLAGPALPLAWGLAPALLAIAAGLALAALRGRTTPTPEALAALPGVQRWALAALLLAPAIPLATLAARTIAALCVAFPGAIWVAAPALLAALALPRCRSAWSMGPVLAVSIAGCAAAGWWGARFEAADPHARGQAYSGPILGIHPFQSTAIAIDGYGPFDLPINDFVEPDGSKGYDPPGLAAALERDLKQIAAQQFAERGPARAHQAFADAKVEALQLPPVRERLDRPAEPSDDRRIVVTSGGVGARSRVEFVCPGARVDPRPRRDDPVMERMCPDKYASEASAGLGLTGRWTGYTELRGQPRLSLARALGWPRSDDRAGTEAQRAEQRLWAWLALGLVLLAACGRSGAAAQAQVRWGGGAALAVAAVSGVLLLATGPSMQVEWFAAGAPWEDPLQVAPWVAALALASGHAELAGGAGEARGVRALPTLLATAGAAGGLASAAWLRPDLTPRVRDGLAAETWLLPFERVIAGLGEGLHRATGLGVDAAEAIAAAAAIAALVGLLAVLAGPTARAAGISLWPGRPAAGARLAAAAVLVPAALLVLSRKTLGAAALLGPAAALALLAGSGLALCGARRRRALRIADHGLGLAVYGLAAVQALALRDNGMMQGALVVGGLVALASLALVRSPSGAAEA